jgi:hypothetical protein
MAAGVVGVKSDGVCGVARGLRFRCRRRFLPAPVGLAVEDEFVVGGLGPVDG